MWKRRFPSGARLWLAVTPSSHEDPGENSRFPQPPFPFSSRLSFDQRKNTEQVGVFTAPSVRLRRTPLGASPFALAKGEIPNVARRAKWDGGSDGTRTRDLRRDRATC